VRLFGTGLFTVCIALDSSVIWTRRRRVYGSGFRNGLDKRVSAPAKSVARSGWKSLLLLVLARILIARLGAVP